MDKQQFLNDHPNIPKDNYDAWKKYPKYNWVYQTTKLLELQGIKWSPFIDEEKTYKIPEYSLRGDISLEKIKKAVQYDTNEGYIFIDELKGELILTDVAIYKGDISWIQHYKNVKNSTILLDEMNGDIKLRINAIISMHFKKYTGTISFTTIGKNIIGINLKANYDNIEHYPEDWLKKVNRLYNNKSWG